jgi:phospholipase/carboxylesterase
MHRGDVLSEAKFDMRQRETVWGGLTCQIVDDLPDGVAPRLGAVLCHGFGAPGTDLVALAPALYQVEPKLRPAVQFVFPAAPLTLEEFGYAEGRAWWRLNLERLQRQLQSRQLDEVRNHQPAELPAARAALTEVVHEWSRSHGLAASNCVLGGFSQGAMLSIDVALHLPDAPAGLAVLSGALMNEREWQPRAPQRAGLPVFQSHGRDDFVLPFVLGQWACDLLQTAGCQMEFVDFDGGHEIPWEVLDRLAAFLVQRL